MTRQPKPKEQPPVDAAVPPGAGMTDRVRQLLSALERLIGATKGRVHVKGVMEAAVQGLSSAEAQQYMDAAVVMVAKHHQGRK